MSETSEWSCLHISILHALHSAEKNYKDLMGRMDNYVPTGEIPNIPIENEKLYILKKEIEPLRIIITLISCSLIEAYINFYLALKTDSEQFSTLEKISLLEKWTVIPSLFIDNYEIDKSTQLYSDLKQMIDHRNRLIHTKPFVARNGDIVHKGFYPKYNKSEHKQMLHYISLPIRLLRHLLANEMDDVAYHVAISSGYSPRDVLPRMA